MAIKTYRPTTPSRRHMTVSGFDGVDKQCRRFSASGIVPPVSGRHYILCYKKASVIL